MDFKYFELKCRYYHGGRKYLMIGPLREEIVSVIPSMMLYHNVLFDDEIKKIKELAKPKVKYVGIGTYYTYIYINILIKQYMANGLCIYCT